MPPIIVWDVDDVLNDLMRCWFADHWCRSHPHCSLSYQDLAKNPPHELLAVSRQVYLASLDEFRLSPAFAEMEPVADVLRWFRQYGADYQHIALTAVPRRTAAASAQWVIRHFGHWIRTFSFVPSPREDDDFPQYAVHKGEFLRGRDVLLFIDDSEENLRQVACENIKTLLFPRPWNRAAKEKRNFQQLIEETLND